MMKLKLRIRLCFLKRKGFNLSAESIFITGTDTGIGKTIITGLLLKFFRSKGVNAITQKWIQTGNVGVSEDIEEHFKIAGINGIDVKEKYKDIVPYIFSLPASPHLAAQEEDVVIDKEKIRESLTRLKKEFDTVLVEGSGGFLVPISNEYLLADLVTEEKMPVLIVSRNKLGAINHTLLTVQAVKKRGLKILGIVFNRIDKNTNEKVAVDNMKIVEDITGEKVFGEIKNIDDDEKLYEEFVPIADKIFSEWR